MKPSRRRQRENPARFDRHDPVPGLSVCLLVSDLDAVTGGIQSQSFRLLGELNRRGVRTCACVRNYHRLPRNEVLNQTVIHRSPVVANPLRALNSILYILDGLLWLFRHRHQYDVIHCQQPFGPAILGLLAKRLLGKPVLVGVHLSGPRGEVQELKRLPFTRLRVSLLGQVDRWAALTGVMKDEIQSLGVPAEKIAIVPNAAVPPERSAYQDGTRERMRSALGLTQRKIAVYSGRLSREKGLDTLLHAWKLVQEDHPDAHLLLLGAGGLHQSVEGEIRELHAALALEKVVHFCGHVPNVTDYLLASDVFVLATRAEGLSSALIEAMAAGTAIVTTDIPENRAVVDHEVTALLVRPDDPQGLARTIGRLFADPGLAERLARVARQKAERELSVEAVTSRYLAEYTRLMNEER
ncbi:MAG: glycosyltransferase family 4 protein [Gemmatimonadota bacterium]|nr:glycosyltransferase family 4 protein [Gemmatimonadota bacterium]